MLRWRAGEEIDDQTGISQLASAMCCLAIVRDAQEAGTLVDNRRGSPGVLAVMDRYDASSMPVTARTSAASAQGGVDASKTPSTGRQPLASPASPDLAEWCRSPSSWAPPPSGPRPHRC